MHGLNTRVAKVQAPSVTVVCAAAIAVSGASKLNGGVRSQSASVLVGVVGKARGGHSQTGACRASLASSCRESSETWIVESRMVTTIAEILPHAARKHGDKTALIVENRRFSFRELDA